MIKNERGGCVFYQWDKNQKICIETEDAAAVQQVHFSGRGDRCREAAAVLPYFIDGKLYADVPNRLLQFAGSIEVYLCFGTADGTSMYSTAAGLLTVLPREQPSDYVYTETEILSWGSLDVRVKKLEEGGGYTLTEEDKTEICDRVMDDLDIPSAETDKTLTQEGTAADAKAVGDEFNRKKELELLFKKISLDIRHDGFINIYGSHQASDGRSYASLPVKPGQVYSLTTYISSGQIPAILFKNASGGVVSYDKLGTGVGTVLTDYIFTVPEGCAELVVQSASFTHELSLRLQVTEYLDKSVSLKKYQIVHLDKELLTYDAELSTGWTGNTADGYTHAAGYDGVLKFNGGGVIDVGEEYICEFDTTYTANDFVEIGIGDAYKILVFNGTGHITVPLKAIGGVHLYFKPFKNIGFTISNLSLRRIRDTGERKGLNVYNTAADANDHNLGSWNVVLGECTMDASFGGTRCVAIGNYTMHAMQGGHRNVGIGTYAMSQMTGGETNVALGADSMFETKYAKNCIAIGKGALHSGSSLQNCIAIGPGALTGGSDSVGFHNIGIGTNAGMACKGERNLFIGYNTADTVSSGIANIYIGDQCTGANGRNHNIVIGAAAKATGTANRSIAIGYQAETTKENQCVIGGADITEVVIAGKKILFHADGTVTWEALG
ncbi:MAG: hypothetical protein E7604_03580 [Ruminococcaceae bacterium]|nr:hypothetical protein [Oscillospiraceae bacterium]